MNHKRLWLAAGIIALVIVIGFAFSVPHTTRDIVQKAEPAPIVSPPTVTLKDVYKKGTHTITGSLQAPNACTSATATAMLEGSASSSESIRIALTLSSDPGVCLELPTTLKFSTTLAAPAGLPIAVTVDGVVASTTGL
jgi:hypothetical protein